MLFLAVLGAVGAFVVYPAIKSDDDSSAQAPVQALRKCGGPDRKQEKLLNDTAFLAKEQAYQTYLLERAAETGQFSQPVGAEEKMIT